MGQTRLDSVSPSPELNGRVKGKDREDRARGEEGSGKTEDTY